MKVTTSLIGSMPLQPVFLPAARVLRPCDCGRSWDLDGLCLIGDALVTRVVITSGVARPDGRGIGYGADKAVAPSRFLTPL